jgi:uncharacterized metal-binding protein (TIGR02443 family)
MRRFIAGAVCPRCGQLDKIVMLLDSVDKHRECVSCGYSDALDELPATGEPATRVNQPRANEKPLSHEDEIQVLKLSLVDSDPKDRL